MKRGVLFLTAALAAGCYGIGAGEPCEEEGTRSDCAGRGFCTAHGSDQPRCRVTCDDESDCGSQEQCVDLSDAPGTAICVSDPVH